MDDEISSAVAAIMASRYQPKVGDRVRVRLNRECSFCFETPEEYRPDIRRPSVEDVLSLDGSTGVVIEGEPAAIWEQTGHTVRVKFDRWGWFDSINEFVVDDMLAPEELEPIS